ncbi:protocadherin Fat 1-like [Mercenaria mercenaria]|uniref:protocadherin Fat 1-like n=1 Tax=Mercenaria mercenaria TaxID=6596 RepID=UPI00234F6E4E|nr:protocadherin Fat 1-like [Mercenaria mercenaria]
MVVVMVCMVVLGKSCGTPWNVLFKNFTVNSKTGEITTKGKIDRELFDTGNDIYFFVYAIDHGEPPRQNTTYVKINVIDINDHIPQFVKSLHNTFSVKEDTPLNKTSALFQVSAVDPDFGSNGVVVYSIHPGNQSIDELFRIDNRSGIISMKKIPTIKDCDHRMYTIEIKACNPNVDEGKCNKTEVICYIKDVNNQQPKFLYWGSINYTEHTARGEIKLCFNAKSHALKENNTCNYSKMATDSDCLPEYNTLHYWMDNDDSRFQIDTSTGIISIKNGSVIDYDEPQRDRQFNFTIYASDTKSTTSAVLTLDIYDHQDSLPHFVSDVYSCSLKESLTPIGHFNCSLKVTNIEDIQIHIFKYSVKGGDPYFSYETVNDKKEIEITLNNSLNYETLSKKVFQLNVTAEGICGKRSTSNARC